MEGPYKMTPDNSKKTKKKSRPAIIVTAVIICLCVVLVLLIGYTYIQRKNGTDPAAAGQAGAGGSQNPGAGGQNTQPVRNASAVRVTPVAASTIENSVVINGDVLARNQVSIFPAMPGKLIEARLRIGDRVSRGDVVAMIDPSRPGENYLQSPVISTISGTVLQAPYNIGDTLSTQSAVYVVGYLSSLRVETRVPERFVSSVRLGLGAQVRLEAIPGEVFYAEVDEVSPVLDPASRTIRILLRFVNQPSGREQRTGGEPVVFSRPGDRIRAGMFATISLVTQTRANVPVIPRISVINTYGSWIVFTVDENGIARRREVKLGIENEEFIEVLDGVEMGERIVSAGQNFLTDGDPVRILE
jgi:multidrug efflux pump subunit AcrA (membrane-fusion protein)